MKMMWYSDKLTHFEFVGIQVNADDSLGSLRSAAHSDGQPNGPESPNGASGTGLYLPATNHLLALTLCCTPVTIVYVWPKF